MAAIDDMVWETSADVGTGPYTLTTVVRSFNEAFGTGGTDTFNVYVYNADVTSEWLYGSGHLSDATTLVIDTIDDSSNGGSAVNFSAGTKNVTCDAKAAEIVRTSGAQTISDKSIQSYGEPVTAIGSIGGGTQDIDLSLGNVFSATVDTSETTFTFSNPKAAGTASSFTLVLVNGGSQTVNWPASVRWPGGIKPTLTASGQDVLTFVTFDAGTNWYGFAAGLNMLVPA